MSKTLAKPRFTHAWIALDDIEPHPDVQRQFRKPWAEEIAARFDPESFAELYVVPHPKRTGRYWVFDGQHRLHAARSVLGKGQKVYCRVYEDRPIEDLARIAIGINKTKAWRSIDTFQQRLIARDAAALEVAAVATKHGLRIQASAGDGVIRASSACEWVTRKAGGCSALDRTLSILTGAWGRDADAFHQDLIRGVALLCNRYDGELSDHDLIAKLKKQSGPARLLGRARDLAKVLRRSVGRAAAGVMADEYNSGRRSGRLPEWPA